MNDLVHTKTLNQENSAPLVAIYSRYSSNNQREESITAQETAMIRYIKEKNYSLVKRYADEAMTGTNTNRPQFQQMLVDAQAGMFDILIVHKLDRLSRDVLDSLNIQQILAKCSVRVESVIEDYDDSPEGELFKLIQMGMNQYYSRNLGREVMKGLLVNAESCKYNGGGIPYGYKVNPETSRFEIIEEQAEAVRIMFEKFTEGWSYGDIADYLNLHGFKNAEGNPFTNQTSFHDILKNEKYYGIYVYNRTSRKNRLTKRSHRKCKDESEIIKIPGGIPAIVSEELFNKAQEIFKSRDHSKRGSMKAKQTYILSGLIVCEKCGRKFQVNSRPAGRNKNRYYSYVCGGRKIKGEEKCKCKEIKREIIEDFVLKQLFSLILNKKNINKFVSEINQKITNQKTQQKIDLPKIKKRLSEIKSQSTKLTLALSMIEDDGMEPILLQLKELDKQKKTLTQELDKVQESMDEFKVNALKIEKLINDTKVLLKSKNDETIKSIIQLFIKQIIINDEAIKIEFNLDSFFNARKKYSYIIERIYNRKTLKELVV
ncbi:recombinase family protein [Turicibacter sanguinis]|uniref:recombinase family protein n=1 Tax=Turicibacter sanguinis TaxID=154288 RepID=UPI00189B74B8|nr:recombinase family protein [Turicibacter sanguinis]MDB8556538.1 recombinase family protein [Turicibacter sanguinis]